MKRNIGNLDRAVRIVSGFLMMISGMAIAYQQWLVVFGFLITMTGITGWCPTYKYLGGSTYHPRKYSHL